MRDLTCRFPGCEQSAEFCDIDHTIAYPTGPPTPPTSNAYAGNPHLLKTFSTGSGGWADTQLPDGTVIWTAPTGKTYKTVPGSRIFFPGWNTATADLPRRDLSAARGIDRGVMMPRRRRTPQG